MKTILYLFALLFFSLTIYAQKVDTTKTYLVEYDFKTGLYKEPLVKSKVDRPVVYKVININRLAFDVQVNSKDVVVAETDWFTSAEDLKKITGLLNQTNTTIQPIAVENVKTPEIKSEAAAPEKDKKNIKAEILISKVLDDLSVDKSKIEFKIESLENQMSDFKTNSKDSLLIVQNKQKLYSEFEKEKENLKQVNLKIAQNEQLRNEKLIKFQNAKISFNNAYDEFIKSYDEVNTIIQTASKVLPIAKLPFLNNKEYVSLYQKSFQEILQNLNTKTITSNTINTQYTDLVVSYNKLKDVNDLEVYFDKASLKKYFDDIDLLMDNAKKIKFKEELIDFEKLSQQVQRVIHLLEKKETYEYISAPIQPKNDMATFDVVIKAKNKEIEVDNSRSFTHSVSIQGGTRIDFSIGLAASYFGNTNVYEIYTIDGQNKIGLKSKSLTVPSLVTMITMTNRNTKYGTVGGSAGLGIDTTNGKIQLSNFFIGPTLILGKYDRMMITAGAAIRNVGQLKNGYFVDETIITQSSDVSTVLTDNYKIGFFVGLTYNLTNNVRTKIANYKP